MPRPVARPLLRLHKWLRPLAWYDLVYGVLALIVLTSFVLGGGVIAYMGLLALVVAMWLRIFPRGLPTDGRFASSGRMLAARQLLIAALVTVAASGNKPSPALWGLLALAVLMLSEVFAARLAQRAVPVAVHLRHLTARGAEVHGDYSVDRRRIRHVPLSAINLASLAAVATLSAIGWGDIIAVLVIAPAAVLTVRVAHAAMETRARFRDEAILDDALTRLAPEFVLYWSADPGTAYQVGMWLPLLERLGRPFIVITRTVTNMREAAALTTAPVLYCRDVVDIDRALISSLRVAFYVNNAARNTQFVRYPQLTHVMLNHGDSDKPPSYNPVSRMYDLNFVAGHAAIERFHANRVHVFEEQFRIVSRPQLVGLEEGPRSPGGHSDRVVLYAPTWRGHTEDAMNSSLDNGIAVIEGALAHGCTVIFRPHLYSHRDAAHRSAIARIHSLLSSDRENSGRAHVFGDAAESAMSLEDCINASDVLISDVSSVIADYLYTGRPIALIAARLGVDEFVAQYPIARAAYVVDADATGLGEALDQAFDEDGLSATRASLRREYLGIEPGDDPEALFLRAAYDVLDTPGKERS